jgi:hypothetical protein
MSRRRRVDGMPFGKYKGLPLSELPDWYLEWLIDLRDLRDPLRFAVGEELDRRDAEEAEHAACASDACPDTQLVNELVSAGLKALARAASTLILADRLHAKARALSDRMHEINAAAAWLRRRVQELPS